MCNTLREIAKTLKLNVDLIDKFVQEAIQKGLKDPAEIITFIRQMLIGKAKTKCKDILSEKVGMFL